MLTNKCNRYPLFRRAVLINLLRIVNTQRHNRSIPFRYSYDFAFVDPSAFDFEFCSWGMAQHAALNEGMAYFDVRATRGQPTCFCLFNLGILFWRAWFVSEAWISRSSRTAVNEARCIFLWLVSANICLRLMSHRWRLHYLHHSAYTSA